MTRNVRLGSTGIVVQYDDTMIALDPCRSIDSHFTFVSHAHIDHLHKNDTKKKNKTQLLASRQTTVIAQARGYYFSDPAEQHVGFQLVDTGHILGSRGLLIGDDIYYTGDISMRERAFMKPARVPSAKTLIIESTFGRPDYAFPPLSNITQETNKIISEMYDLGIPVILMGYKLGKAQLLTKLFDHWEPIIHESVAEMNSVYSELGVKLENATTHSEAQARGFIAKNKPWVMIAPLMSSRSAFVKEMKDKYGAVTIGFTGWAKGRRYRTMMGLDYVMPLSDHCDYDELVEVVRQCNPEKVYTFHGFSEDFAKSLLKLGFDSESVAHGQSGKSLTLDSFL